jgi:ubiquinone/menaquinone biosynthesis C-methylase UbiE
VSAYQNFAQVYDLFMQDVPYEMWAEYIEAILGRFDLTPRLMADLGCGTGTITTIFAKKGIEMIGIDASEDMLTVAREKALENKVDILYLLQDMREFELYGTVDCIISLCDSLNYILKEEDLLQTFKWVNNYLNPKGLFIFDMNTEYKYKNILSTNTFAENLEDASYIWENDYDEEDEMNEYGMTFFVKKAREHAYEKFEEQHYERMYSVESIKRLIEQAGMELLDIYDAFGFEKPRKDSERIYFVAREKGKQEEIL